MLLVNHAVAAINEGLCSTVLITHAESGKSRNRHIERPLFPSLFQQQFERPFGATFPPTMFPIPVLRYMKDFGLTEEKLAMVSVVQREWAAFALPLLSLIHASSWKREGIEHVVIFSMSSFPPISKVLYGSQAIGHLSQY